MLEVVAVEVLGEVHPLVQVEDLKDEILEALACPSGVVMES